VSLAHRLACHRLPAELITSGNSTILPLAPLAIRNAAAKSEARMKKNEAKRLVLQEWDDWAAKNVPPGQRARGTDGLIFFGYLQSQRPDLLKFKASGDRWLIVHGWLAREGKIVRTEPP
jgi:hypothetical protein